MKIEQTATGHELILVYGAVASRLVPFLNPQIPFIWILVHMHNRALQWRDAEVPLSPEQKITARVRMLSYDMQLSTEEFMAQAEVLDDHGLVLIQSRKPMPDTLELSRIPES